MFGFRKRTSLPAPGEALPGRAQKIPTATRHAVNGHPLQGPWPAGFETAMFGLGCFWGAERKFWQLPGVFTTAVGYAGGYTPNPTYEEVCSGRTGHTEVVLVMFDPEEVSLDAVLRCFWESHDPTQGHRQGNDVGTQYRSAIYAADAEQLAAAELSRDRFDTILREKHFDPITTELAMAGPFFYAEDYHQQYLARNPNGYCGLGGTGVSCPVGIAVAD